MVRAVPIRPGRKRRRRGEEVGDEEIMMTNAEILIKKGKRGAAAFVQAECISNGGR